MWLEFKKGGMVKQVDKTSTSKTDTKLSSLFQKENSLSVDPLSSAAVVHTTWGLI